MGIFVIAAYRPRPGKAPQLLELLREHMPILRSQELVTDHPVTVMRAGDATILEIFEWKSQEAIDEAHRNPAVLEMWARFEKACEYVKLADLAEAKQMFPGFAPVDLVE